MASKLIFRKIEWLFCCVLPKSALDVTDLTNVVHVATQVYIVLF